VGELGSSAAAAGPVAAQTGSAAAGVLRAAAQDAGEQALAAQAGSLVVRLDRLADVDAPDARRDFALGRAVEQAAAVPLAIAEACADVVALARELTPLVTTGFAPDVEAARLLAAGAAAGAAHLVEVNLVVGSDDVQVGRAQAAARAAAE
jgi:formiminotetrahydrofolate cyclodeaminase